MITWSSAWLAPWLSHFCSTSSCHNHNLFDMFYKSHLLFNFSLQTLKLSNFSSSFWISSSGLGAAFRDISSQPKLSAILSQAKLLTPTTTKYIQGDFFHWYPPISAPKRKPAKQPITAFLSNMTYRNSSSDWLAGNFPFWYWNWGGPVKNYPVE